LGDGARTALAVGAASYGRASWPLYTVVALACTKSRSISAAVPNSVEPVEVLANVKADLADAAARVRDRHVGIPRGLEYVHFDNFAKGAYSRFRPLVAVATERGVVYLNSKAKVFAEEGSA
jgi:hypothetical protein